MSMFGSFRGKLYGAKYWLSVAAGWTDNLLQLRRDDTDKFVVDTDGNVESVGGITATAIDLGDSSTITENTHGGVLAGTNNIIDDAHGSVVAADIGSITNAEYSAILASIESSVGGSSNPAERSAQCFIAAAEGVTSIGHSSSVCAITSGYTCVIGNGCHYDVICGGLQNTITDGEVESTIGGGWNNSISGSLAVIPGGMNNVVSANFGIASGCGAQSTHAGASVWCDQTGIATPFASTAENEWSARATGGFRFVNSADGSKYVNIADGAITASDKVITPALKVTGGTPGAGKLLVSDADGEATWTTPGKRIVTFTITPYGQISGGGHYFCGNAIKGAGRGMTVPSGFQPIRIELFGRNDGANSANQALSVQIGQVDDDNWSEFDILTATSTVNGEYKAERHTYTAETNPWVAGRRLQAWIWRSAGTSPWQYCNVVITAEVDA